MNPNTPKPSVSFIVLALNEEENIESTAKAVVEATRLTPLADYEVILVDDGSTDATGKIMERIAIDDSKFRAIHNEKNLGLGGAWKRGVAVARCDYVMMIAGDNIMPASDIGLILNCVGEADIVLPYLTNPKLRSFGRRLGSWGFKTVVNILFGMNVKYYQGILPRRELLGKITIKTDSYAFPAEVTVKLVKAGCSYVEVGIPGTPSRKDKSVALQPKRLASVFMAIIRLVREISSPGAVPSAATMGSSELGRKQS